MKPPALLLNPSRLPSWPKFRWPLAALGLLLLFNFIFTNGFFHLEIKNGHLYGSLVDVLHNGAPVILLTFGMTLVIATGGVDLSVGSIMAITGAIAALLVRADQPVTTVLAGALSVAALAGLWNGLLVSVVQVPPIVATLILMVSGRGLAQLLTSGQILTIENQSPAFALIGRGHFLGMPLSITLVGVVLGALSWLTQKTALGLFIESTGDNETASRYAGVNTRGVKALVYAICALCAGLAGLIAVSNIQAADSNNVGLYLELDAILAAVIGGTALKGGEFSLTGSLIGAVLIQTLTTTILTRGVDPTITLVVKSVVIIGVCLLQAPKFRNLILRPAGQARGRA
jgi:simple sugar transport system permease protein